MLRNVLEDYLKSIKDERLFDPPEAFRSLSAREQARFRKVMLAAVRSIR